MTIRALVAFTIKNGSVDVDKGSDNSLIQCTTASNLATSVENYSEK